MYIAREKCVPLAVSVGYGSGPVRSGYYELLAKIAADCRMAMGLRCAGCSIKVLPGFH